MAFFLAIDAGGTRAEYILADEKNVLARVSGGTIKRMRASEQEVTENLEGVLRELETATGVSLARVTRTCIGTAGYTVPLVTEWLRKELQNRVGGELLLLGDIEIALDAAFPSSPGVLVLAGTGSNVAGRASRGEIFGAGGYGPMLSDQGSGHRIGEQALRRIFLCLDERKTTAMLDAVLQFWSLKDVDALVAFANACSVHEFSKLVPLVLRCAEHGDEAANAVLCQEGESLAHLAALVYERVRNTGGANSSPPVAFAGSVLAHVGPLRRALMRALRQSVGAAEFQAGVVDPVLGALWRARQAAITS